MRLVASVRPSVDDQSLVSAERFPAQIAAVGLLPSVDAHVYGQGVGASERLAAGLANVWSSAGVGSHVDADVTGLGKARRGFVILFQN